MGVNEHTQINRCCDNLSALPAKAHRFVCDMRRLQKRYPYMRLTPAQKLYLHRLHDRLVRQGIVEGIA